MYERFSNSGRNAMKQADHEAKRLNHMYIGTEHILLGLMKERSGAAATVLGEFGLAVDQVAAEVERIAPPINKHEIVGLSRLPHTPKAKQLVEYAIAEARGLGHNWIGTEHLFLGLLRIDDGDGAKVLANLGLDLSQVREAVLHRLVSTVEPALPPILTEEQLRVLEDLIQQLSEKKEQYAADQDFEQAARYRDAIGSFRLLLSRLS